MIIKEGFIGRQRNGAKVVVEEWRPRDWVVGGYFKTSNGSVYPNGRAFSAGESDMDIVAEWIDKPVGPVRTVTCKEITPGTYGQVRVLARDPNTQFPYHAHVRIDDGLSSAVELRAAAATLTEIADALDEQEKNNG